MSSVVSAYVGQSNAEILYISQTKSRVVNALNQIYNLSGLQLVIEQRARYQALDPVPLPNRDRWLSQYPMTPSTWVDALSEYGQSTRPHMHVATIEAIANYNTVGGQSIVALMRQERNLNRLEKISQSLDNVIPGAITPEVERELISNGTLQAAKRNEGLVPQSYSGTPGTQRTPYTRPSILVTQLPTVPGGGRPVNPTNPRQVSPKPKGFYDPNIRRYRITNRIQTIPATQPYTRIINPYDGNASGFSGIYPVVPPGDPRTIQTGTDNPGLYRGISGFSGTGVVNPPNPRYIYRSGPTVGEGDGGVVDDGSSDVPGSWGGSEYTGIIPPNLDTDDTSNQILPSQPTVDEAIEEVIKCNCECWVD
jgi:hypothetical protein